MMGRVVRGTAVGLYGVACTLRAEVRESPLVGAAILAAGLWVTWLSWLP